MPDGDGYVVLANDGLVYRFGSATDPRPSAPLGMGYLDPGDDVARSIAVMPDGKGLRRSCCATAPSCKDGSAAAGPARRRSASRSGPAATTPVPIAVMPDGHGYVVLDNVGRRVEVRHAPTPGSVGAAPRRRIWGFTDTRPRHRASSSSMGVAFGYYVLDAAGGVCDTSGRRAAVTNPSATPVPRPLARHRPSTAASRSLLRNDGSRATLSD